MFHLKVWNLNLPQFSAKQQLLPHRLVEKTDAGFQQKQLDDGVRIVDDAAVWKVVQLVSLRL